jgi:hypothetical protein
MDTMAPPGHLLSAEVSGDPSEDPRNTANRNQRLRCPEKVHEHASVRITIQHKLAILSADPGVGQGIQLGTDRPVRRGVEAAPLATKQPSRTAGQRAVIQPASGHWPPVAVQRDRPDLVFLCSAVLGVNVRICRDPRSGLSQISWRTSVAHHPTEDTPFDVRRSKQTRRWDIASPGPAAGSRG